MKYAEPKYSIAPTAITPNASLNDIFPLGSSLITVLGFLESIDRSMTLFRAKAIILAPVAERRTKIRREMVGELFIPRRKPL